MGAVDLAPAGVAVVAEPEVGLVEVAEQEELAHPPRRRQPQDVLDPLPTEVPVAVHASFSHRSVRVSVCSPSHVSHVAAWPSAENASQELIGPVSRELGRRTAGTVRPCRAARGPW